MSSPELSPGLLEVEHGQRSAGPSSALKLVPKSSLHYSCEAISQYAKFIGGDQCDAFIAHLILTMKIGLNARQKNSRK
jgi:hypothetical protein